MATTITSEVVGRVKLPAGAPMSDSEPPAPHIAAASSKLFADSDPQIQALVRTVLGLYTAAPFSADAASKVLSHFVHNATWDTNFVFCTGAARMRALARLAALPCGRVAATPRVLTVSMVNETIGRIDVEGVVEYVPRLRPFWPLTYLLPRSLAAHTSWAIIARGEDDKVLSVTERIHNLPSLPYPVRALGAAAASSAVLTVSSF